MNWFLLILACEPTEEYNRSIEPSPGQTVTESSEIDVTSLYQKMKSKDVIIIDVRTPQEYTQGHLPKAQNIPLQELNSRMEEIIIHKDKDIYLVCASGRRSHSATQTLKKTGFSKAKNVLGGTRGWQAKGYPTEK